MDPGSPVFRSTVILAATFGACALRRVPYSPLDRPTIFLLGGIATVLAGVLTLDQAVAAVNLDVIALLLGMMLLAGGFAEAGVYARISRGLEPTARARPRLLLLIVLLGAGALAAVVTNDTVCVFFAPLVIAVCRAAGRRPMPYLLALMLAANTGSAATLVGNPQNMVIGVDAEHDPLAHLTFARYAALALPVALGGLAVSYAFIAILYRGELGSPAEKEGTLASAPYDSTLAKVSVGALLVAVVLLLVGVKLVLAALIAAAVLLAFSRRDQHVFYPHVDVSLLVLFGGLFVVTAGAAQSGVVEALRVRFAPQAQAAFPGQAIAMASFTTVGSQLVSNVPFVVATTPWLPKLAAPDGHRVLLALVSTLAGNLTLVGSVANLIVAGIARHDEPIGFFEHLRVGLPVTFFQVAGATAAVVLYVHLGWI